jgi:hypothetical protein
LIACISLVQPKRAYIVRVGGYLVGSGAYVQ